MDFLLLQATTSWGGTGLEWMPFVSFILPAIVLMVIFFAGRKNTV